MDLNEEILKIKEENQQLKEENRQLKERIDSLLVVHTQPQTPTKPVVKCPAIDGSLRAETLSIDTLICFYEPSGKDCGLSVNDGLANEWETEWLSYGDSEFDYVAAEEKIASAKSVVLVLSKDSLIQSPAVFIVLACGTYNIPIISVHDLSSCMFPNPSFQPQQILDAGLFNDKAITFVRDYVDTVLEQIVKQLETARKKRNFCLLYSKNTPESDLLAINQLIQSAKTCKMMIQSDDIPSYKYLNNLSHTISLSSSLIYILDKDYASNNFLIMASKLAIQHKSRIYFVSLGPETQSIQNLLESNGSQSTRFPESHGKLMEFLS